MIKCRDRTAGYFKPATNKPAFPGTMEGSSSGLIGKAKTGKPAEGYRPICLISILAKLYEKMIKVRLEKELEEKAPLSDRQFDFVKPQAWDSTSTNEKTLTTLTARLMAEEARLQGKEAEEISVAFVTNEKCFKCKKAGHFAKRRN
ncbi:hypothetical protein QE152_g22228 [Popillia japonica]|uniref:Reverse transcriptase domain-containing protein n=1 Tax=Popillia japonica TaxID=7064 RepID=A0AAW1KKR9_POPJA